jgi:diguanylate cyclase (GGDEF)-like protein
MQPTLSQINEEPLPPKATTGFWGSAGEQRSAIKRLVLTWWTYAFADFLLLISGWAGFIPNWVAYVQVAYHWAGMAIFYVLIRRNYTARRADRAMAFEQVVFAVSALVLSYALAPESRGASLQLLCLVLAFDMQRLTSRQLSTAAWSAVALLCITLALTWWVRPENMNIRREIFNLVMAGIQLPALSLVAKDVRWLRKRQLQQRVDLQEALNKLQEVSQRDALTGLFNRYHMNHLIDQEVKRFARNGRRFAVAILDIDHFKLINDRHGHAVGDAVLQNFAKLATDYLSEADAIARWGGEEFLVLMPEQGLYQGMATVDGLRRHIEQFDWAPISPGLSVRFSGGVTEHHLPKEGEDQLVARADQALYRAKAAGRNQVCSEPRNPAT